MTSEIELFSELRRHDLLVPLLKCRIIAEAVSNETPDPEQLQSARKNFLMARGLIDTDSIHTFLDQKGWTESDLDWQIELPLRIKRHCHNQFRHKAESRFLTRKDQLDFVSYSLLRTKDIYLARELYLRIDAGEANFGDLASEYSEGPERETKGIIGPVAITKAHPALAEALRVAKPGVLMKPIKVEEWWLVMRLESYKPATFDERTADILSHELFEIWVNQETSVRIQSLKELSVAPTAE